MEPIWRTRLLFRPTWRTCLLGQTPSGKLLRLSLCRNMYWPHVRCFGTFANYLGHVRGACHAMGFEAPPVGHAAIRRAMIAIAKRELFRPRPKHFVNRSSFSLHRFDHRVRPCCIRCRRSCVTNMVLAVHRNLEELNFAMLWLTAYLFLLRLPSEVSAWRGSLTCANLC